MASRPSVFVVVTVERLQGGLQLHRDAERIKHRALAPAFFGHLLADMFPEFPEHGHFIAGDVLGNRYRVVKEWVRHGWPQVILIGRTIRAAFRTISE